MHQAESENYHDHFHHILLAEGSYVTKFIVRRQGRTSHLEWKDLRTYMDMESNEKCG